MVKKWSLFLSLSKYVKKIEFQLNFSYELIRMSHGAGVRVRARQMYKGWNKKRYDGK